MGEKINCPECGTENTTDSQFCQECGSKLADDIENRSKNKISRKKGLKILAIIILAIFLISSSIAAYYVYIGTTTKTYNENGISFQYPGDWNQFNPYFTNEFVVVDLESSNWFSGDVSFRLSVYDSVGKDLNYWANGLRSNQNDPILNGSEVVYRKLTINSEKSVQIAGVSGYRIDSSSTYDGLQSVEIIFVKNNKAYDLGFTSYSKKNIENDLDVIVNSFQVT